MIYSPWYRVTEIIVSQIFQKLKIEKKKSGDIIILQKWIKNHDHTLYCSQDMVAFLMNSLFISDYYLTRLCPPLPNSPKIQNFEKMKKTTGGTLFEMRSVQRFANFLLTPCSFIVNSFANKYKRTKKKYGKRRVFFV